MAYKLFHGDCLEVMKCLESKSIDMILCDLPYGVTSNKLDIVIPFSDLWENYERLIKDNGAILLFAQGIFYVNLVVSNIKLFRYDLIWDKMSTTGFLNAKKMPLRRHEQIAVFYKKTPVYNPQFIKGKMNHSKGTKFKNKIPVNNNYSEFTPIQSEHDYSDLKYPTSILEFSKVHNSKTIHRTQKPVELLEYLIKMYTNENAIVLDNCMGSGSTGVACMRTNRNFIGIEKDETYFKIAKQRIEESSQVIEGI